MKILEYPLLTAQLQPLTKGIEDNSLRAFAAEIVVSLKPTLFYAQSHSSHSSFAFAMELT